MKDNLFHRRVGTRNTYGTPDKDLFGMAKVQEIIDFISGYGVTPLFLSVTGSHMWNIAEPDADLDIRGIYIKPTEMVLSLQSGSDTIEANRVLRKDIDIQLYEVQKAFNMMLHHNGNIMEMLFSPTKFYSTMDVDWDDLAKPYITKRLAHYYKGYYHSQRTRAMRNRGGKALLYTYREIYQGIYLMRHGKYVYDFHKLKEYFDKEFQPSALLEKYMDRKTWLKPLTEDQIHSFEREWDMLLAIFEREYNTSSLPETFESYSSMNEILLDLRRKNWTKV